MSFEHRPSPARVTEAAAAKLPRWMFFGLLAAYILPGLLARDPWSLEDASAFGVMWTMAHGGVAEWWLPSVVGEPLPEEGPLPFWVGALMIRLFGGLLGDIVAARLVPCCGFLSPRRALWYATYRLARRPEAQPVAFAFGGEANPRDYGRMLADIAVLLMLATIGIVFRLHETVAEAALFAFVCNAAVRTGGVAGGSLERNPRRRRRVGRHCADARPAAGRRNDVAALIFVLSFGRHRLVRAIVLCVIAIGLFAVWPLAAQTATPQAVLYFDAWWAWNARELYGPNLSGLMWLYAISAGTRGRYGRSRSGPCIHGAASGAGRTCCCRC